MECDKKIFLKAERMFSGTFEIYSITKNKKIAKIYVRVYKPAYTNRLQ